MQVRRAIVFASILDIIKRIDALSHFFHRNGAFIRTSWPKTMRKWQTHRTNIRLHRNLNDWSSVSVQNPTESLLSQYLANLLESSLFIYGFCVEEVTLNYAAMSSNYSAKVTKLLKVVAGNCTAKSVSICSLRISYIVPSPPLPPLLSEYPSL